MRLLAVLLAAALAGCAGSTQPTTKPEGGFDRLLSSTVALFDPVVDHIYCSGVIIDGTLWTAAHCIDNESGSHEASVWIKYEDGVYDNARFLQWDRIQDWARLKPGRNVTGVRRALAGPELGENVWTVGHPMGLAWTLLWGHMASRGVRSDMGINEGMRWWQLTLQAAPGNSGGPCVDANGQVFGLVSFIFRDGFDFTACADITGAYETR